MGLAIKHSSLYHPYQNRIMVNCFCCLFLLCSLDMQYYLSLYEIYHIWITHTTMTVRGHATLLLHTMIVLNNHARECLKMNDQLSLCLWSWTKEKQNSSSHFPPRAMYSLMKRLKLKIAYGQILDLPNQRTILLYYQESWIGAHYIRRGIPLLKCVVLLPSRTKNIWTFFEPTAILVLWSHIQHLLSFWIQHLSDFWYYLYDSKSQKHGLEEYLLIVGSPFNTNLRFHSSRHFNLYEISAYSKQNGKL